MPDTKKKTFDLLRRYDQIKVEMKEADAMNRQILGVEALKDKLIGTFIPISQVCDL